MSNTAKKDGENEKKWAKEQLLHLCLELYASIA